MSRRIPRATYRLQLNRGFTFRDAAAVVPYLARLGVSDCYASPFLKARPGSIHGYDVCDHARSTPSSAPRRTSTRWSPTLREHGMGQILDIVPNHMGIGEPGNAWWMDVLENGPGSSYAGYFDIDWQPVKPELRDKVLLPILGDQYGLVLEKRRAAAGLRRRAASSSATTSTGCRSRPRTYRAILRPPPRRAWTRSSARSDAHVLELQSILTALGNLPPRTTTGPGTVAERSARRRSSSAAWPPCARQRRRSATPIEATVRRLQRQPGDPRSFDLLDALLERAGLPAGLLAGGGRGDQLPPLLRRQRAGRHPRGGPEVFEATHQLVLRLAAPRARSPACASTTPTACATPPATSRGSSELPRARGARRAPRRRTPLLPTSWPRRSCAGATSGLPRRAWAVRTAPPATTSSTRQRAVRRPPQRAGARPPLPRVHRRDARLRRRGLREEAADHAQSPGQRDQRAGHRAGPHRRAEPALPRLHPQQPDARPARGHRLPSGLPHLHRRGRPEVGRTRDRALHRAARSRERRSGATRHQRRPSSTSCATCCCCATPSSCRRGEPAGAARAS